MNTRPLLNRLYKNEVIAFEDAEILSKFALPVPEDESDEEAFVASNIYVALGYYETAPAAARNEDDDIEETFYVDRLTDIMNDRAEMVRWRIRAGHLNCKNPEALEKFSNALAVPAEVAKEITAYLDVMAENNNIAVPPPRYMGPVREKIPQKELDEIDLPDFRLDNIRKKLEEGAKEIDCREAVTILQNFLNCSDDVSIRKGVKRGLKAYDTEFWVRHELKRRNPELTKDIAERAKEVMKDEYETIKWLVLSVADLCITKKMYNEYLAQAADCTSKEAFNMATQLEFIAENDRIINPRLQQEQKLQSHLSTSLIENFIANHVIQNPKPPFKNDGPELNLN